MRESTARFRLQRVPAKTGTRCRQTELIRLMLSFPESFRLLHNSKGAAFQANEPQLRLRAIAFHMIITS